MRERDGARVERERASAPSRRGIGAEDSRRRMKTVRRGERVEIKRVEEGGEGSE